MMSLEDIKYRDFTPTFEEKAEVVRDALVAGHYFEMHPWNKGEIPSIEEISLVWKDKEYTFTKSFYLQSCLALERDVPKRFKDLIEMLVDREGYEDRMQKTENLVRMDFEMFLTTNPTIDEAIQKLIQLSGDYWNTILEPEAAREQIKEMYPDQLWRGTILK